MKILFRVDAVEPTPTAVDGKPATVRTVRASPIAGGEGFWLGSPHGKLDLVWLTDAASAGIKVGQRLEVEVTVLPEGDPDPNRKTTPAKTGKEGTK